MHRRILLVFAALALLTGLVLPGLAAAKPASCGNDGYSYAGLSALEAQSGVSAAITALHRPTIASGHVAAWVGVGGIGLGPRGSNEWLQAGISAAPGQPLSFYYEVARPGSAPRYEHVPLRLKVGRAYQVSVIESSRRGFWQVFVNGTKASAPIYLPGSHGAWKPVATTESWDGGTPACNSFSFAFSDLLSAAKPAGDWVPMNSVVLDAPGYHVVSRTLAGFIAVGGR